MQYGIQIVYLSTFHVTSHPCVSIFPSQFTLAEFMMRDESLNTKELQGGFQVGGSCSSNMSPFVCCIFLGSLLCDQVWSISNEPGGLSNKHLIVAATEWSPFWNPEETSSDGRVSYSGIMYDILMLMKKARNCTFTVVPSTDGLWGGTCYGINNCTGMIGMANREEVDIAIGDMQELHTVVQGNVCK